MYDSVDPSRIPVDAQLVAGYIAGPYAWHPLGWLRFPTARKVRIAPIASLNDGDVLDVERTDASPDAAPGWVARRRAAGADPSVYCSVDTWPVVRAAFKAHDVAEPHYWLAHYGVAPVIPDGAVALQYANEQPPGCDTTIVADYWPGVDPAPQPPTGDTDLTPQEHAWLQDIFEAVFGPSPVNGGEGHAPGNNLDIIRRKVSPYDEGYPPANPPAPAPAAAAVAVNDADPAGPAS
jgi:hypothetical protein